MMTKALPANFSPELFTIMKSALDTAVDQIDRSNRTPATKAKMAQRIVKTASEGITDLHVLMSAAVDEGRVRAA
jgi:saccharopine dehydrogenase-like NADP-dependent oxidoreductase